MQMQMQSRCRCKCKYKCKSNPNPSANTNANADADSSTNPHANNTNTNANWIATSHTPYSQFPTQHPTRSIHLIHLPTTGVLADPIPQRERAPFCDQDNRRHFALEVVVVTQPKEGQDVWVTDGSQDFDFSRQFCEGLEHHLRIDLLGGHFARLEVGLPDNTSCTRLDIRTYVEWKEMMFCILLCCCCCDWRLHCLTKRIRICCPWAFNLLHMSVCLSVNCQLELNSLPLLHMHANPATFFQQLPYKTV